MSSIIIAIAFIAAIIALAVIAFAVVFSALLARALNHGDREDSVSPYIRSGTGKAHSRVQHG